MVHKKMTHPAYKGLPPSFNKTLNIATVVVVIGLALGFLAMYSANQNSLIFKVSILFFSVLCGVVLLVFAYYAIVWGVFPDWIMLRNDKPPAPMSWFMGALYLITGLLVTALGIYGFIKIFG